MTNSWSKRPLEELCELFTDGDWVETKDQSSSGVRLVQTGNVGEGKFKDRRSKARFISNETFERRNCEEILPGDCLVSRLPDPVGRACIVPDTGERMITAVDCTIMRFEQSLIVPDFYLYYSQSSEYLNEIDRFCTGATRKRISRKNLGKVEIPGPSLEEQKRIVAILDEAFAGIDAAIANTEKNLANARELFDSCLNAAFSGDDWPVKYLCDVTENLDKKRVPITKAKRKRGAIPYYGASGIVDYVADYIFDEDLLLVSEDGANLLARTYPIAFSISGKSWVNNHAHILKFQDLETQKFVEYYLNSISIDRYVTGMAQPKLNQKALNSIPVPFPPIEVQKELVTKLDDVSNSAGRLIAVGYQKREALLELKQALLQKAFSGELTAGTAEKDVDEAVA